MIGIEEADALVSCRDLRVTRLMNSRVIRFIDSRVTNFLGSDVIRFIDSRVTRLID